ncbi:hypothetical protein NM688_g8938 [Phlebia brevispora]|uniref:Uncharacterized protein n=1 Tax=Phlebia brevispora TaxID=194682 RepID=A0ACC1RLN9_9APHY|nr:hypothetical protein NM688_g8938 [Phlebia brevispora]
MVVPQPDPVMQAVIEASFDPVDIAFGPPDNVIALCSKHSLEKCAECDVDFTNLNRLSRLLQMNPSLRCPPPPTMLSQKLSVAINNTKEEGNTLYKSGQYDKAIQRYSMAANFAAQRPPWEAAQMMREELSAILSNRSAAFFEMGDYINALVDADQVIQLKRPWGKGHFRKAKALLSMKEYQEAKEAIELGLEFEPESAEMITLRETIENHLREQRATRRSTNGAA